MKTTVTMNFTLADETQTGALAGIVGVKGGASSGVLSVDPGNAGRPAAPRRAGITQRDAGMVVRKVQPEYPTAAKAQPLQGRVRLDVTVDKEGEVDESKLIRGHPMLAPAAIEAVRQWKYRPYLLNGKTVEMEMTVTVNFDLLK